ncbi:MAG: UDP-3-O-[3-hydroxymyristoyl] N-acetylglucosamine deacetylase [Spirochaetes bacterium]|nr:UDP-3-O-[3-hydroxymyristoyl] N-acetylglucosamine deacetylase [Spirochaetota bacterium]
MNQTTIKKSITLKGIGIHTGKKVSLKISPLEEDQGIIFKRSKNIVLNVSNIVDTTRAITLGKKENSITTIEHLVASIYMSGITNLLIEVDNEEIPALDGSSLLFIKALEKAGIRRQSRPARVIKIKKPLFIIEKDKYIGVLPSDQFGITYHINFPHPDLQNRIINLPCIDQKVFKSQIAGARTFGFMREVESLMKKGLALGGSMKNAVVLTEDGYLNKRLRFKDECLRHKVLDLVGCLGILGIPVKGHFLAYRSGHTLDLELVKKIAAIYKI